MYQAKAWVNDRDEAKKIQRRSDRRNVRERFEWSSTELGKRSYDEALELRISALAIVALISLLLMAASNGYTQRD
jgi:hypothetical protein